MRRTRFLALVAAMAVSTLIPATPAAAAGSTSKEPVTWIWEDSPAQGRSVLTRDQAGVSGRLVSGGLTPGDAVTLWIVVFNTPEGCATTPCTMPDDVFNPDANADFHWADGAVVEPNGMAAFDGRLNVGDVSGSGKTETGMGTAVPLLDPAGAEVRLTLHSHGPAASGDALVAQLTTFLGGCAVFTTPNATAAGPNDVPDEFGECSAIQSSIHR